MPDENCLAQLGRVNNSWKVGWVPSPNLLLLKEWGHGSHLPWGQVPCPPSSLNMSPCWYTWPLIWIPEQVGWYHGGPYHLNGVLVFGQLWRNARDYPQQAIPMQGSNNLCKPWQEASGWLLDSACHGTTSQVRASYQLVIWVVAVVCGPGCLSPYAAEKDPLEWAQWILLWLCSLWVGSADLDGMIFTQLEGGTPPLWM